MQHLHDILMATIYLSAAAIVAIIIFYAATVAIPIAIILFSIFIITEFIKADRGE